MITEPLEHQKLISKWSDDDEDVGKTLQEQTAPGRRSTDHQSLRPTTPRNSRPEVCSGQSPRDYTRGSSREACRSKVGSTGGESATSSIH